MKSTAAVNTPEGLKLIAPWRMTSYFESSNGWVMILFDDGSRLEVIEKLAYIRELMAQNRSER